jgi:hypothetical protein
MVWKLKRNYSPFTLPLLGVAGLAIGAGAGWWLTLPEWRQHDLQFRAVWQARHLLDRPKTGQRPYRYFAYCSDAHAAGYYSITRNEPSYREKLDADHDGVACEPYRGQR